MKTILFTLFSISTLLLYSQKIEEKIIYNNTLKSIVIEGDAIFKINVRTTTTSSIILISKIEGENAENTTIITEIKNDSLLITSAYQPFFKKANDKLSAHKVLSIEVSLEIPEHLYVYFKSEIASADVTGKYKQLILELNQGNANLDHFDGNAIINTINGNIHLETNYATINATTKTGKLNTEEITKAKNEILIHSINGNINIFKTKN
ncbi:DUF4097 family beta strand repeat-containing protein [Lacinutrix jangbogonensis]|uniref:hypothetical protein n=1 Tax=Lacinutrix jangbogonensis TaxID=1469557 RepID=UPI00068ED8B9|nr:hypothetical protein [Lacinutrix jangbogonensis]